MVLSMFLTDTQQLTWALADSIHTFPKRYTTPGQQQKRVDMSVGRRQRLSTVLDIAGVGVYARASHRWK